MDTKQIEAALVEIAVEWKMTIVYPWSEHVQVSTQDFDSLDLTELAEQLAARLGAPAREI